MKNDTQIVFILKRSGSMAGPEANFSGGSIPSEKSRIDEDFRKRG